MTRLRKTINFAPEVDDILASLISGIEAALTDNLIGIYLRGSLAAGDFIDTSDVDFAVATERPVSEAEAEALIALHARLAALQNPYANLLEGAYIDRASLRRFVPGRSFLTVECDTPLRWQEHGYSSVIERYVLREKGIALLGPDPKTLIDPISDEELRDAVRHRLADWAKWATAPDNPESLPRRGYQAYVVETMCRALYTLACGELASKRKAAAWAASVLPGPWRGLVERSVARRADPTDDEAAIADVLSFVQWVATESEKHAARA
jgi:predicted nucleotidyltransferase